MLTMTDDRTVNCIATILNPANACKTLKRASSPIPLLSASTAGGPAVAIAFDKKANSHSLCIHGTVSINCIQEQNCVVLRLMQPASTKHCLLMGKNES